MSAKLSKSRIGIFDSGVGGLTIYQAIQSALPDCQYAYCSDNEFHPYGTKSDEAVALRTVDVCARFVIAARLDFLVIACNTASTVALAALRSKLQIPIVGVVPAIKPAAENSRTGVIGLLATPATIKRPYVDDLIMKFAGHCRVLRAGSSRLVELAEAKARGNPVDSAAVRDEIKSLFVESSRPAQGAQAAQADQSGRLDTVVLGCTHFPLLREDLIAAAPWPVQWIDSGDAIAARVQQLVRESRNTIKDINASANEKSLLEKTPAIAWVTRHDSSSAQLEPLMLRFGFSALRELP